MSADRCDKLCKKKDSSSEFNNIAEVLFKVLIIGDVNVGKSSLLKRFVENTFVNAYSATIGVDLKTTKLSFGHKLVKLQVWDTGECNVYVLYSNVWVQLDQPKSR